MIGLCNTNIYKCTHACACALQCQSIRCNIASLAYLRAFSRHYMLDQTVAPVLPGRHHGFIRQIRQKKLIHFCRRTKEHRVTAAQQQAWKKWEMRTVFIIYSFGLGKEVRITWYTLSHLGEAHFGRTVFLELAEQRQCISLSVCTDLQLK